MAEVVLAVDGAAIAGRLHGDRQSPARILCIHGQIDNAASFDGLADRLSRTGYVVFAMDLSGHGRSSWRPFYDPALWALEVLQVLDALGWSAPVTLLGHSFGTSIVTMVAGSYPERISAVVLIEGLGLWPDYLPFGQSMSQNLRNRLGLALRRKPPKTYASIAAGIEARLQQLVKVPTGVTISSDAVQRIVIRGMKQQADGGMIFAHDPAVMSGTSCAKMSHEDARDLLSNMPQRCLLFHCGHRTYPDIPKRTQDRKAAVENLEIHEFKEESHHLHADRPDLIAPIIIKFLADRVGSVSARL